MAAVHAGLEIVEVLLFDRGSSVSSSGVEEEEAFTPPLLDGGWTPLLVAWDGVFLLERAENQTPAGPGGGCLLRHFFAFRGIVCARAGNGFGADGCSGA